MSTSYSNARGRNRVDNTTNNRLINRDLDEYNITMNKRSARSNINRIEIERDEFLKCSTRFDDDNTNNVINRNDDFGELSGEADEFERGMPQRSSYEIRRPLDRDTKPNDFSLLSTKSARRVDSFDPGANLAGIDTSTKITEQIQNKAICVTGNNNYGLYLYSNLMHIMKSDFIFSPVLLYSIFSAIFLGCEGNTEIELKNYFNYPRSDILNLGIREVLNIIKDISEIKFGNCIIFSEEISFNQNFCAHINPITKIRKINYERAAQEAETINNIISKSVGTDMKKSITSDNLMNSDVIFLNYAYIDPIWRNSFRKQGENIFMKNTGEKTKLEYMVCNNETFGYMEINKTQILEVLSKDNMIFGIILGDLNLSQNTYENIVSNIKPTILSEVRLPLFRTKTKMRYTNILKKTSLSTIFLDLNVPELFLDRCKLDDCIQNIEINISSKSVQNRPINKGIKTTKKFVADKSFRYYIRPGNSNCILFAGMF